MPTPGTPELGPLLAPRSVAIVGLSTKPGSAGLVVLQNASHVAEQDDVHNGSVFHPATVVFPPALAVAQALGASGRQLLTAAVAGYEVGIRVGEFLGRSHYKVFHTTGTAGTLAAAATARHLLGVDAARMQPAVGSGRWTGAARSSSTPSSPGPGCRRPPTTRRCAATSSAGSAPPAGPRPSRTWRTVRSR